MNNIQEYLKDITDKELRAELNRRNKKTLIPAKDRERCKTCKHCVSATKLVKMIKNKEIDADKPFAPSGHYCLIQRNRYNNKENLSIFNYVIRCCELYENKDK